MYIRVIVSPKAKKETVRQTKDNEYHIAICEPAERNLANRRVLEIIKTIYPDLQRVRIISGHHHTTKLLSIE